MMRLMHWIHRVSRADRGVNVVEYVGVMAVSVLLAGMIMAHITTSRFRIGNEMATVLDTMIGAFESGHQGTIFYDFGGTIERRQVQGARSTAQESSGTDSVGWASTGDASAATVSTGDASFSTPVLSIPATVLETDWGPLREILRQIGGVFIGFGEGFYDMVTGILSLISDLFLLLIGDAATHERYRLLLEALGTDFWGTLGTMLWAIVEPIVADWQAGNYGEAIGRAIFELLPAILAIFTGGATAAGYLTKTGKISTVQKAGTVTIFSKSKSLSAVQRRVSINRLRNILGRAGVSPRGYNLRKATKSDYDYLRRIGVDPNDVYAWVSRDGTGRPIVDRRGRPIITFTEKGLSSIEEAIKTYGHEVHHIKDFVAGRPTSEAAAESAGEALWQLIQSKQRSR